ncbi:MAG: hypothetical protein Q7R39_02420 [Dehalococcoidia bacterium]|nr:hypothetical protein [Dehalococcoidia bacterium]
MKLNLSDPKSFQKRNGAMVAEAMLDGPQSALGLAFTDGATSGGTANCIMQARKLGVLVETILVGRTSRA